MRILIPKAQSEQRRWQAQLDGQSVEPVFCDPWQIDLLPQTAETKTAWLNLDLNAVVFCVSPTAAKVLVDALDEYWPMPPEGVRWLCNGPRTARVLNEYGLAAEYPSSGHTSEDVYKMVEDSLTSSQRYLIICGEGGRDWMRQTLQQQGVQVGVIRCYQRAVNTQVLAQMTELITTCQALWLSSEYLGEALMAQAADFWRNWPGAWWLSSNRLDQWAEQQGIINRFQAGGATPEDLSRLIKQHAGA